MRKTIVDRLMRPAAAGLALSLTLAASALAAPLDPGAGPPAHATSMAAAATARFGGPRTDLSDSNGNGLSDGFEKRLAALDAGAEVNVIVTFSGPGDSGAAKASVGDFTVNHEFNLIRGFSATMTAGQARALASAPGVFRVEEDAKAYATLESARRDFGVDALQTDPSDPSTQTPTGNGIHVCVLDTGVQADHEQFVTGGVSRVVAFLDMTGDYFGDIQTEPYDDHGHGTHVTGIISGDGLTDPGGDPAIAPLARGVAPQVFLHVAKVLNYNGTGDDSGIIVALEWCVNQGVKVANFSLGIPGTSDGKDALSTAVDAAVDLGVVVVVAAGNSGDGPKTVGSPAAAAKAIAVGAVAEHSVSTIASATSNGIHPAPFSSHGPTKDGRIKPDIAGPGVSILSAMTTTVSNDPDPIFGGGGPADLGCGPGCYIIISGSSMASPFVAGAAALVLEAGPSLTPDQVRQVLISTAHERGVAGKDNVLGHGLIDVKAAVGAVAGSPTGSTEFPHTAFRRASVPDNGAVRIPLTVVDPAEPLAVTVAIDGKSGRLGWTPDLDMILLDQLGNAFLISNPLYPWFSSEPMVPAPGTSSTCPAGEDCGLVGAQETIHIRPGSLQSSPDFFLEVYGFTGWPNNGKGGTFAIELSNAYFAGPVDGVHDGLLVADTGATLGAKDSDGDGLAEGHLDGRASRGPVASYEWRDADGSVISTDAVTPVLLLPGDHTFTLTVGDGVGGSSTDTIVMTAQKAKGGGGGGGGKPSGRGNSQSANAR